ncbi:hypothetical protein L2E82_38622 [Cichorium intybus]|uniref:Uncharacterized protein n=1 Tax=Cichorium intybus TaxID=13427 RepID=A0ACB9AG28_CICIN|nr:hypothetical protein L2E82_38622 [Cichorium intybus]
MVDGGSSGKEEEKLLKSLSQFEQEKLLKSKPAIIGAVDELEKFRQPLSVAVEKEISLALQRRQATASEPPALAVDDLLSLIYFGSMFDVKSESEFEIMMLTSEFEREACLVYDRLADDDAAAFLRQRDLDLISMMSSLLVSSPVDSRISHQHALQRCIDHAKLWLSKSEQRIVSNRNVTYADVRDNLTKMMASDYFKKAPQKEAPAVHVEDDENLTSILTIDYWFKKCDKNSRDNEKPFLSVKVFQPQLAAASILSSCKPYQKSFNTAVDGGSDYSISSPHTPFFTQQLRIPGMASGTATGPVLTLINKRIRNLRKKLNRITQLEDSIARGRSIIKNKEQEELLKSKPAIIGAVDELEKFRQPLSVAVKKEISLALQRLQATASEPPALAVDDLLSLIYFGSMFDVKPESEFKMMMLMSKVERVACLAYDRVARDDPADCLEEMDFDLIPMMSSLLVSSPVDSRISHQHALQRCIDHAKLWLSKSEQRIVSNRNVTYADVRELLRKMMASDYFKKAPQKEAPAVQVEGSVTQQLGIPGMASGTATGPVLNLINKRIRKLRKKLNRIAQLEDSIALGRSNIKTKEQEELLKSKPAIIGGSVDELKKFCQPLSVAVEKEISLALQRRQATASEPPALAVDDLLSLIYFGSLFDVKSVSELESIMRTRKNERDCCLAYDRVAADFLEERDLDLIAMMSSLLISGFLAPTTSHQQALQRCIDHAKLWLSKSEQRIDSNSDVTYADVREKLTKIMASDYFKEASDKQKDQQEAENSIEIPVHEEPIEPQTEDNKEQQVHRRPYQNQRGGGRGGCGWRGYSNGRGGRIGGRGGRYQKGCNSYYEYHGGGRGNFGNAHTTTMHLGFEAGAES